MASAPISGTQAWKAMLKGSPEGVKYCVRGKLNMQDKNKCLRDPVPRGQTTAAILRAAIDVWLLRTHGESQSCILKSIDCYGRNQCEHRSPIS